MFNLICLRKPFVAEITLKLDVIVYCAMDIFPVKIIDCIALQYPF